MISLLVTFIIGWLAYQIQSKSFTLQDPPTMLQEVNSRRITLKVAFHESHSSRYIMELGLAR